MVQLLAKQKCATGATDNWTGYRLAIPWPRATIYVYVYVYMYVVICSRMYGAHNIVPMLAETFQWLKLAQHVNCNYLMIRIELNWNLLPRVYNKWLAGRSTVCYCMFCLLLLFVLFLFFFFLSFCLIVKAVLSLRMGKIWSAI